MKTSSRRNLQPGWKWCATFALTTLIACATVCAAATADSSHLRTPILLRCDHQTSPLAVADGHPELSWTLEAASPALHGVAQSAYQIQVFKDSRVPSSSKSPLWDSGIVRSGVTSGIGYDGPALMALQEYVWKVRVWDGQGHATAWSDPARWTQAPDWRARWIAEDQAESGPGSARMPLFRKGFTVGSRVQRAILYASGLGQDELRLNGRKVGNDELTPGWSDYRKTVYYDTYDVTALLRPGSNVLGVMLGNGMYRVLRTPGRYTKFVGSFGPPECALLLHLELAGGASVDISTDATWKSTPGPITFSSTYGGEDYDARLAPAGWDSPGYNDADWHPVKLVDGPGGALRPELAPPIRVMHTYLPVKVTHPSAGVAVYDLGQNFAGWPEITVQGVAGAEVKLIPGELLNPDGTVSQRSSGSPQWFTYTLRGTGVESWHPRFSYYGFRYVQVETPDHGSAQDPVRIVSLLGQAVHTSSPPTGSFTSSDVLLNRIHTLILRAIENNAVSLFTDCPHREKLGWLEETHLLASAMLYDFDFARLYAATARNIADAQAASGPEAGRVPEIAPQYVVFGVDNGAFDDSPEWGSAAVLAPWYVYQRYGDRRFLAAQLDVMRRYVAYLGTRAHNGIIAYGLGDWFDIGPGEPGMSKLTTAGVTATAIYYQDIKVLEAVTALLGRMDESREYARLAASERDAFNARFFDAARHRYDRGSQTAQAMPLVLGLVPEGEHRNVLEALVSDIHNHHDHVTAGDVGFHYVVEALLDGGRSDVLLAMLNRTDAPSYGYQLAQGATSLTEAWDANPSSSQDHFMLGHAEEWFYRGLGGINVDLAADGDKRLVVRPAAVKGITSVDCSYRSSLGLIGSNWRRTEDGVTYDITIPVNATATIDVAASSITTASVDGLPAVKAPGVRSAVLVDGHLRLVVGSGHYLLRIAQ
ncbi:MAG TPA: family 78 glycoside hydrolase catalytic domain [Terracidiphilus sp.]|nr:family 78 glycoside hydrolase catalytic domain [Terracidiphilus sp.]